MNVKIFAYFKSNQFKQLVFLIQIQTNINNINKQ